MTTTTMANPRPTADGVAPPPRWRSAAVVWGLIVAAVVSVMYLLLLNPYWIRHGDSEAFLGIARNLAHGEGFSYNGNPVSMVPPGWPLVLAAAMKFTASLLTLKLILIVSMLGFLLLSYLVLLRLTSPPVAALCVMTAALLNPVISLSTMFFSDGPFALLAWVALWQAMKVGQGDAPWWRVALVVVLSAAAVTIRWPGILWCILLAAAMIGPDLFWRLRLNRRWVGAAAVCVISLALLISMRFYLRVDPSRIDERYDAGLAGSYGIFDDETVQVSLGTRVERSGMWIAGLLYLPVMQAHVTRDEMNVLGWVLIAFMAVSAVSSARRRQWLGAAVMLHLAILFGRWANPLPRYIMLMAPLILWMIYDGITRVAALLPPRVAPLRTAAINVVFASTILLNGAIYLSELLVMRSGRHFYDRAEGGTQKELIDAAWYLNHLPRTGEPYEVAISSRRANFGGKPYSTGGYFRALNFLTNRPVMSVPYDKDGAKNLCREPDDDVVRWLVDHNVRFYLYQPPIWVVLPGHFAPKSDDEGFPISKADTEWRLYEIKNGEAHRVMLDATRGWPRHVPGL